MKKRRSKNFTAGAILTGVMLLFVLAGFFWTPYDPETMDKSVKLAGVSLAHPMGCDNFGRDVFSRVMVGARTC